MRARKALTAVLCCVVCPAMAQDVPEWLQRSELRAHERLLDRIGDVSSRQLMPFTTDGCSGGLSWAWTHLTTVFPTLAEPDGEPPPWELCCVAHDRAYHDVTGARSAEDSYQARLIADRELQLCVTQTADLKPEVDRRWGMTDAMYERLGETMFWAVRFGGGPCTGLSWRWGYGFEDC
ncbi:MAG: hypothetical protein GJ676_20745 [Rhodobacteraceae bacterium]|nr:hypothetical protein [Paracoccaceae bacterium]